jgi:DedD protein
MMHQQVKERVVGAVVLVLFAVIFIPMMLDGAPQKDANEGDFIPTHDGVAQQRTQAAPSVSGFSSRIVPLGEQPAERTLAIDKARTQSSATPQKAAKISPVAKLRAKPITLPPKPAAARPPVRKAIAAPATQQGTDGWVVQLGSFSSARNAHALRDRLKLKGYKAFARTSGAGKELVTRVYVGPDATPEWAQQRVASLLAETRLQGIVLRYPK